MALFEPDHHAPLQEEYWISLSDLMAGLMMMFLLIAILFMVRVEAEAAKASAQAAQMKEVAVL